MKNKNEIKNKARLKAFENSFTNWRELVSSNLFQEGVANIKEKYGIHKDGFKGREAEHRTWRKTREEEVIATKEHDNRNPKTYEERGYRLDHDSIYLQSRASKINATFIGKFTTRVTRLSEFNKDIDKLRGDLPRHWSVFITNYVLWDVEPDKQTFYTIRSESTPTVTFVIKGFDDGSKRPIVRLEFGPNTGLKDIAAVWKDVLEIQKRLKGFTKGKVRTRRKLKRDIELEKLGNLPVELRNAGDFEKMQKQSEILAEDDIELDSVSKAIRRLKTRRKSLLLGQIK